MTSYTACPTFTELVSLFQVFAGDGETWREIVRHRANCETCISNERATAEWREHEIQRLFALNSLAQPVQASQGERPLPVQALRVYETIGGASQELPEYWTGEYEGLDNAVPSLSLLGNSGAENNQMVEV